MEINQDHVNEIVKKWQHLHRENIIYSKRHLLQQILLLVEHQFRISENWDNFVPIMLLNIDLFVQTNPKSALEFFKISTCSRTH